MNTHREPFTVRWALALHALFLRGCPGSFRRRFGVEIEQTFVAACRAAHRRGGTFAVARTAVAACAGAVSTAWRLHMTVARSSFRRTLTVLPVAILLAALAGYVDQHEEDVQMPALLVFATAFVCSWLQPRAAWLWWLAAGAAIPVAAAIAASIGHAQPFPSEPYSWLIAFLPALLGAGAGVGVRHAMRARKPPAPA